MARKPTIKRQFQSKAKLDTCTVDCSSPKYMVELTKVLNELNLIDNKEKLKWLSAKQQKAARSHHDEIETRQYCIYFKLLSMGAKLSKEHLDFFSGIVDKVENQPKNVVDPNEQTINIRKKEVDKTKKKSPQLTIQDHIKVKADNLSSLIDEAIDDIITKGKTELTSESLMSMSDFSPHTVKYIKENFAPMLEEFNLLESKKCPDDLKEGYSFKGKAKTNFNKMIKFLKELLASIELKSKVKKTAPKARVVKVIPPTKQVEKIAFNNITLGSNKAIHPSNIIGSSLFIAYDKKNRQIWEVVGDNIQVKGKSLVNIDIEKSKLYRIRKPDVFFSNKITTMGKRALAALLQGELKPLQLKTPRLNDNLVFLKVF